MEHPPTLHPRQVAAQKLGLNAAAMVCLQVVGGAAGQMVSIANILGGCRLPCWADGRRAGIARALGLPRAALGGRGPGSGRAGTLGTPHVAAPALPLSRVRPPACPLALPQLQAGAR